MIGYILAFWTLSSEQNVCSLTIGRQGCEKSQATSCKVNRYSGVGVRLQISYKKLDSHNTSTYWLLETKLGSGSELVRKVTSETPPSTPNSNQYNRIST